MPAPATPKQHRVVRARTIVYGIFALFSLVVLALSAATRAYKGPGNTYSNTYSNTYGIDYYNGWYNAALGSRANAAIAWSVFCFLYFVASLIVGLKMPMNIFVSPAVDVSCLGFLYIFGLGAIGSATAWAFGGLGTYAGMLGIGWLLVWLICFWFIFTIIYTIKLGGMKRNNWLQTWDSYHQNAGDTVIPNMTQHAQNANNV